MAPFSALIISCTIGEIGIFSCQKKKRGRKFKSFFFLKERSYRAMTQPIQTIKHPLLTVVESSAVKSFHAQCSWSHVSLESALTEEGKTIDGEFYFHRVPSSVGSDTCYGSCIPEKQCVKDPGLP